MYFSHCVVLHGQDLYDWENGTIVDANTIARPPAPDGSGLMAELISKSESAEFVFLNPIPLHILKIINPKLANNIGDYVTLYDRQILKIRPVTFKEKNDMLTSLSSGAKGMNSLTFHPTLAIRCFLEFSYEVLLVSLKDRQVRICMKESETLYIVSQQFCDLVKRLTSDPSGKIKTDINADKPVK